MNTNFSTKEAARKIVRLAGNESKCLIFKYADCPTTFATYWIDRFGWQICWSNLDNYNVFCHRVAEDEVVAEVFAAQGEAEYSGRNIIFTRVRTEYTADGEPVMIEVVK